MLRNFREVFKDIYFAIPHNDANRLFCVNGEKTKLIQHIQTCLTFRSLITTLIFTISILVILPTVLLAQQIPITTDGYHLYGPNSTWGQYLQIGGNGQATNHAFIATTNGNLHLDSKVGFATYINHYNKGNTFINPLGGNVGVRTLFPTEALDVSGNVAGERFRTGGALFKVNSRSSFNSFNSGLDPLLNVGWISADFGGNDNTSDRLVVGVGFGNRVILGTHNSNLDQWGGELLIAPEGGNVGIGTTHASEKLSVNGKIRAHEIKVETSNWPDYVFEQDYNLLSLAEIEAYIKKNKHLPEMPSAAQVTDHGFELGEMNKLLLKKVEELTLYLIDLKKENDLIKEKIKKIKP